MLPNTRTELFCMHAVEWSDDARLGQVSRTFRQFFVRDQLSNSDPSRANSETEHWKLWYLH